MPFLRGDQRYGPRDKCGPIPNCGGVVMGEEKMRIFRAFLAKTLDRESPDSAALILLSIIAGHPMRLEVLGYLDEFYDLALNPDVVEFEKTNERAHQKIGSFLEAVTPF